MDLAEILPVLYRDAGLGDVHFNTGVNAGRD